MASMIFPQYARGRDGIQLTKGNTVLEHIRGIGGVEIGSEFAYIVADNMYFN